MKPRKLQLVAWALFSASLLLMNCDRSGLGLSAHRDGSVQASADSAIVPAGGEVGSAGSGGSGPGGLSGFGGVTGSGGMAGSGGTQIVTTQPIGADGLLDTGATQDIVVAQDERHVAFMRDYLPVPPCGKTGEELNARSTQVGTLLVATIADDGTVAVRVVGQGVKFYSVGFSSDSKSMAYVDGYDACSQVGVLKTAAADGTNPRTIESGPINFDEQIVGNTLLFMGTGTGLAEGQVYAVWLPTGAPISTTSSGSTYSGISTSKDGRRAAYLDAAGDVMVLDVSTGASHQVDLGLGTSSLSNTDILLLSADGGFLAVQTSTFPNGVQQSWLAVAAAGDTQATSLLNNSPQFSPAFSPDSSRLAYQALDSAGAPELVVHPLAGGTDVHVQGLPVSNYEYLSFSPDGAVVYAMAMDNTSDVISLYTASAIGSGSFQFITSDLAGIPSNTPGDATERPAMPPGDGYLAMGLKSGYTQVFSSSGAGSNLIQGSSPVYEPNSAQPRLLVSPLSQASASDPVPAFMLASTDGTSMKTILLPTSALPWGPGPQWMGHTVIDGFSPALTGTFPAIYAWSGDSSSPHLLAAAPDTYAWAPIAVPTRLFYARRAASSAGPAGLWMAHVP
jgi:Tol biopolymer transport system component